MYTSLEKQNLENAKLCTNHPQKNADLNSAELRESALTSRPGYLEMLGHVFFFGGVMVGPQVSVKDNILNHIVS